MRFLIALFVLVFLGSCASLGKGAFIKRKYNKGYHIDLASHKKTESRKNTDLKEEITTSAEREMVVVEKQESQISQEISSESEPIESPKSSSSNPKPSFQSKGFRQISPLSNVAQVLIKNVDKVSAQRTNYTDFKLGLGIILFIVLTIIYTFTILYRYPEFPFVLAVVVAMLGAALTMLTGATF